MKYTLLQMTQDILEAMDSDEVDTYSETVESSSVARIIRESYWYLVGRMELPAHHTFYQLVGSGDSTKPVLMTFPSDALDMDYLKYQTPDTDGDTVYQPIAYLELEQFMERALSLKSSETEVDSMTVSLDGTDFEFKYYNERAPLYFTTVDNTTILFDAFDNELDDTLQKSKTLCFGKKLPAFTMADTFIPALDAQQFQLLLNEAKSQAFIELKQVQNLHSETRARKSFQTTQRTKQNIPTYRHPSNRSYARMADYGRKT